MPPDPTRSQVTTHSLSPPVARQLHFVRIAKAQALREKLTPVVQRRLPPHPDLSSTDGKTWRDEGLHCFPAQCPTADCRRSSASLRALRGFARRRIDHRPCLRPPRW